MFALLTFLLVEQIEDFLEPVRVVSCFRTTCALLGLYSTGGLTIIMWDRARRAGGSSAFVCMGCGDLPSTSLHRTRVDAARRKGAQPLIRHHSHAREQLFRLR